MPLCPLLLLYRLRFLPYTACPLVLQRLRAQQEHEGALLEARRQSLLDRTEAMKRSEARRQASETFHSIIDDTDGGTSGDAASPAESSDGASPSMSMFIPFDEPTAASGRKKKTRRLKPKAARGSQPRLRRPSDTTVSTGEGQQPSAQQPERTRSNSDTEAEIARSTRGGGHDSDGSDSDREAAAGGRQLVAGGPTDR